MTEEKTQNLTNNSFTHSDIKNEFDNSTYEHEKTSSSYDENKKDTTEKKIRTSYNDMSEMSSEDLEDFRQKCKGTKNYVRKRLFSRPLFYFITFTTNISDLYKNDPLKFLELVADYLIRQHIEFVIVLERYKNKKYGFHIHGLTNKPINFNEWLYKYGANTDAGIIPGENFDERDFNLYCRPIYSTQEKCIEYIIKAISRTKFDLEQIYRERKYIHMFKSNVDAIDCGNTTDIIENNNNKITVTDVLTQNLIAEYQNFQTDYIKNTTFKNKLHLLDKQLLLCLSEFIGIFDKKQILAIYKTLFSKNDKELYNFLKRELTLIIVKYLKLGFDLDIIESIILDYIEDIFLNTEYSDLFNPELLEIELQNIYNTALEFYEDEKFYNQLCQDDRYYDKAKYFKKTKPYFFSELKKNRIFNFFELIKNVDTYDYAKIINYHYFLNPPCRITDSTSATDNCGRFKQNIASVPFAFKNPTLIVRPYIPNISNTEKYAFSIPYYCVKILILRGFFNNYLLKYLEYIKNIPLNTKNLIFIFLFARQINIA